MHPWGEASRGSLRCNPCVSVSCLVLKWVGGRFLQDPSPSPSYNKEAL